MSNPLSDHERRVVKCSAHYCGEPIEADDISTGGAYVINNALVCPACVIEYLQTQQIIKKIARKVNVYEYDGHWFCDDCLIEDLVRLGVMRVSGEDDRLSKS